MRGNLTLCNDRKGQQYFVQAIQKKFDEIFDIWALSVSLLLLYMQPMRLYPILLPNAHKIISCRSAHPSGKVFDSSPNFSPMMAQAETFEYISYKRSI